MHQTKVTGYTTPCFRCHSTWFLFPFFTMCEQKYQSIRSTLLHCKFDILLHMHMYKRLVWLKRLKSYWIRHTALKMMICCNHWSTTWKIHTVTKGVVHPFSSKARFAKNKEFCIERWNHKFNHLLGSSHPTAWKLIKILKKEQNLNDLKSRAGVEHPVSRKRRVKRRRRL